jgi:hypothetical protein
MYIYILCVCVCVSERERERERKREREKEEENLQQAGGGPPQMPSAQREWQAAFQGMRFRGGALLLVRLRFAIGTPVSRSISVDATSAGGLKLLVYGALIY